MTTIRYHKKDCFKTLDHLKLLWSSHQLSIGGLAASEGQVFGAGLSQRGGFALGLGTAGGPTKQGWCGPETLRPNRRPHQQRWGGLSGPGRPGWSGSRDDVGMNMDEQLLEKKHGSKLWIWFLMWICCTFSDDFWRISNGYLVVRCGLSPRRIVCFPCSYFRGL